MYFWEKSGHFTLKKRRPGWGAPFSLSAAAAVIALAAAAAVVAAPQSIAAAVAEQNDQQDDPAQVAATEIIIAHIKYLQIFSRLSRSSHVIPQAQKCAA